MIEKPIQELKAKAQSDQPKARASLAINEQTNIKSKIQTKQLEILNDVTPFYSIMDERARLAFKESSVEIKSATKLGFLPSVQSLLHQQMEQHPRPNFLQATLMISQKLSRPCHHEVISVLRRAEC
jgi:hypothetical protein